MLIPKKCSSLLLCSLHYKTPYILSLYMYMFICVSCIFQYIISVRACILPACVLPACRACRFEELLLIIKDTKSEKRELLLIPRELLLFVSVYFFFIIIFLFLFFIYLFYFFILFFYFYFFLVIILCRGATFNYPYTYTNCSCLRPARAVQK